MFIENTSGIKNKIINGSLRFWQRGTSFTIGTSQTFTADRWSAKHAGITGTITVDRQSAIISSTTPRILNTMRMYNSTANASIAAANGFFGLTYKMEANDFLPIADKYVTLRFYAKANFAGGTFSVAFSRLPLGKTYITDFTLPLANTYYKIIKTIKMDAATFSGGDLKSAALSITIGAVTGTDNQLSTLDQWVGTDAVTSPKYCSNNATNWLAGGTSAVEIGNIQLEIGTGETDFDYLPMAQELTLCQRYCEVGGLPSAADTLNAYPQTFPYTGGSGLLGMIGFSATTTGVYSCIQFKTNKRDIPIMTFAGNTGTLARVRDPVAAAEYAVSSYDASPTGVNSITTAAALTANRAIIAQWKAEAEI